LRLGGKLNARMEAKDRSDGFNFEAIYTEIIPYKKIAYRMLDNRNAEINFNAIGNQTEVIIIFEAENVYPIEMQKAGGNQFLITSKNMLKLIIKTFY